MKIASKTKMLWCLLLLENREFTVRFQIIAEGATHIIEAKESFEAADVPVFTSSIYSKIQFQSMDAILSIRKRKG